MVEVDALAEKIFSLLKGNGLKIKIFDVDGNEVTDPSKGRRFFVMNPNLMVTINEENQNVEFSVGSADNDDEQLQRLRKNIQREANKNPPPFNFTTKIFGKSIQPRDYAYQAKVKKEAPMMENSVQPYNHQLVGKVLHKVKFFGSSAASTLADDLGLPLSDVQPVLNKLVTSGKIVAEPNAHGEIEYSASVEEAVMENSFTRASDRDEQWALQQGKNATPVRNSQQRASDRDEQWALQQGRKTNEGEHTQHGMPPNKPGLGQKIKGAIKKVADVVAPSDEKLLRDLEKDTGGRRPITKTGTGINESFSKMFGTLRTSQQTLENVRILVKHKVPVNEEIRGARSRHIAAIFLECNGERFRFPHNYLAGARAMANHLAHGGTMTDKVGSYITESTGQLLKLQSFNRYVTTNKLINEDSSGIVETVKENIETIRTELKKLTGVKTYETIKARLETFEREQLAEDDTTQLKELFTIRRFDEKFEEVLPIVKQLVQEKDTFHKRIEEAASQPISVKREAITAPVFEFASENARLGYKINELALRIVENDELAGFINKIGTKICKEGTVNDFERAVLSQVLENVTVIEQKQVERKDIQESVQLESMFDKYVMNFF